MKFLVHNLFAACKYVEILVWSLCNELGSVLHNFYENLFHIMVQKKSIPLHTHNKQARKDWRGNISIVYITCVHEIIVPEAYLSILHPSLYQPHLYAREFFKYQLSWQSKILLHKEHSWYLSSRSVFHRLNKYGASIQLLVLLPFVQVVKLLIRPSL